MDEGDIKTLSGDFNAKVSNDKNDWNKVMRNHGIGKVNKNGELLADFVNRTKFTAVFLPFTLKIEKSEFQ